MTTSNRKPLLKMAMIPVLIIVLGLRLADMTGSSDQTDSVKAAGTAVAANDRIDSVSTSETDLAQLKNWPTRSLDEILEHDPFSKPREELPEVAKLEQSPVDKPSPVKFDPQAINLKMIYRTGDEVVALVGSRIVKAGDRLEDGSLVVSIGDQEIVVQPPSLEDRAGNAQEPTR